MEMKHRAATAVREGGRVVVTPDTGREVRWRVGAYITWCSTGDNSRGKVVVAVWRRVTIVEPFFFGGVGVAEGSISANRITTVPPVHVSPWGMGPQLSGRLWETPGSTI